MNKKVFILLGALVITQLTGEAMENKIKFDNQTYYLSNPETKTDKYIYLIKDENIGNWHSGLFVETMPSDTNSKEAAAELAYKIQSENPAASVLVYPEAATVGYLTFPQSKEFYEYNTVVFKTINNSVTKYQFSRRFYSSENNGAEGARLAAITFAENNNKKYMELLNKENILSK